MPEPGASLPTSYSVLAFANQIPNGWAVELLECAGVVGRPARSAEVVYDPCAQTWKLVYTLQSGLSLGQPYDVAGYLVGDNPATGVPWAPTADGLSNLTGRINRDGSATIWAVTSTISGSGDHGADPNQLGVACLGLAIRGGRELARSPGRTTYHTPRGAPAVRAPGAGGPGQTRRRSGCARDR